MTFFSERKLDECFCEKGACLLLLLRQLIETREIMNENSNLQYFIGRHMYITYWRKLRKLSVRSGILWNVIECMALYYGHS